MGNWSLTWLAELMPLFVVRWYARRNLEHFNVDGMAMSYPRPGVFIVCQEDTK